MATRYFRVIAHRGGSQYAPENSLPALEAALEAGADAAECDVRLTKDGFPVLCHDAGLLRTTQREALVRELTFKELQQLDLLPPERGKKQKAPKIPPLEEVLEKTLPRGNLQLDLKEAGTVLPVVLLLQKHAREGAFERVLVVSGERALLSALRMLDSRVRFGQALDRCNSVSPSELKNFGVSTVLVHLEDLGKDFVDDAHKLGLQVQAFGLESPKDAELAVAAGADAALYDRPAELIAWLKENGLRGNGEAPPAKTAETRASGRSQAELGREPNGATAAKSGDPQGRAQK